MAAALTGPRAPLPLRDVDATYADRKDGTSAAVAVEPAATGPTGGVATGATPAAAVPVLG